ncbi:hypothetical protein D039_4430A, partial [Vibrio parahaemolyticus EKP-028]
MQGLA